MRCGLSARTDVPVITTAPARDEHDFDASHYPVSLDRLLAQDREVQATTPCLGVAAPSVHRPRLTMTGLQGGQAQHIADRAQIPLAPPYTQAPVTAPLPHPPSAASRATFHP
jgi:hypothetical protein